MICPRPSSCAGSPTTRTMTVEPVAARDPSSTPASVRRLTLSQAQPRSSPASTSVRTATPVAPFGWWARLVGPRGARDVEVHPGQVARELLEEQRGGDRPGGAPAGIDMSAISLFSCSRYSSYIGIGHARSPARSAALRRCRPTRRACRTARCPIAQRHHARARQRGDVDQVRGAECCAYQSPSPSTSRPSASVFITSTVLPLGAR